MTDQVIKATFEGWPCDVDFTMPLGILPGSGTLTFVTGYSFPSYGVLRISDNIRTVSIEVYTINPRTEYDAINGIQHLLTIYDRRYKWQWGYLNGVYNQLDTNGIPAQEKSLKQLLSLCLDALAEKRYALANIPFNFPSVKWEWENPSKALNELCENAGLVIGMHATIPNNVSVAPANYYRQLPSGNPISKKEMVSGDVRPKKIYLVGNKRVIQHTFDLIPVGEDTDGYIKPIDDLSYKPAGEDAWTDEIWGKEIIRMFSNLATEEAKVLADKCIFKWYAIDWSTFSFRIEDEPYLTYKDVLPLLTKISSIVYVDGRFEHDKPYVTGTFGKVQGIDWIQVVSEQVSKEFSLNKELGIVQFTEPVYDIHTEGLAAGSFIRANIDLVAAFEPSSGWPKNFAYWSHDFGSGEELPAVYQDKNLVAYFIDGVIQNAAVLNSYADVILDNLVEIWSATFPVVLTYPGVIPIDVGGVFSVVSWRADSSGGETEIQKSINIPKTNLPKYEEKLNTRKLKYLWGAPK